MYRFSLLHVWALSLNGLLCTVLEGVNDSVFEFALVHSVDDADVLAWLRISSVEVPPVEHQLIRKERILVKSFKILTNMRFLLTNHSFFKDFSSLGALGSACCKQENCPSSQHLLLCLNLMQVSRGKFAFAAIAVRVCLAFAKDIHASLIFNVDSPIPW